MNRLCNILALCSLAITACTPDRLTDKVEPLIGSGGHGHVFVGASVPFGMVQLGPTSISQEWDWCSGYHNSEASVIGFSHTHLSGTGIGDLFDITIMPVTGNVTYARGTLDAPDSGLWSPADRTREVARPGYYAVPLTRYGIMAELTATARTGMHRYTFPASQQAAIVLDLENGGCWDRATETFITPEGNTRISGYRYSKGWARAQRVYFAMEFSKPFKNFELKGRNNMYGSASFATEEGEAIMLKVGISPVSIEGAKLALQEELPHWDFDYARKAADNAWEKELSRIRITTGDKKVERIFYTAMYHAMMAPALFSDTNGHYRGADGEIYHSPQMRYTNFSLWDTYRAKQPLMTIIQPQKAGEFVASMVDICDKQGDLPVWHLWGNETNCMVGDPAIPVVADAIVKNVDNFDHEKAFEAIKRTAAQDERGKGLRREYGYIPCNMFGEAVAYELEYALADGAVAKAAAALGRNDDEAHFTRMSHSYRRLLDKEQGFLRGVNSTGTFRTPFNPYYSAHRADDYCEGNAWQYTWLVPHDIEGYTACFGGREQMLARLDSLFTAPSTIEGDPSPDISGMIGQFAHGNEPSHHILYLYTMLGEPHKSAELVRKVMKEQYNDTPDGLSGNEDMGQMSAWYIMSALGFYQVEPAGARYWFASPIVDKAEIKVAGGTFTINTINNSPQNIYIKKVLLNGKEHRLLYILHEDIERGGTLTFEMSDKPAKWYKDGNK
ncbi:MAG: GH92 family glycosyl hydrolase [Bacteroidaceae bacterium]|nr:GH92 family glycosyl hydrolase [Bacteroidaceae bacterium]